MHCSSCAAHTVKVVYDSAYGCHFAFQILERVKTSIRPTLHTWSEYAAVAKNPTDQITTFELQNPYGPEFHKIRRSHDVQALKL